MDLQEVGNTIEEELDDKDSVREIAIKSSREIVRLSSRAIMKMHRGENCSEEIKKVKDEVWHLRSLLLKEYPDIYYAGFVQNAMQEYVEAMLFYSVMHNRDWPTHKDLNVNATAYLMGCGDLVGELRREVLENLREENFERAEEYLKIMEEIYEMLLRFNYPSGLVPIKQKQDLARALVEKTRGEITIATMNRRLEKKLTEIGGK